MKSYVVSIDRADDTNQRKQIIWKNVPEKTTVIQCKEDLKELSNKISDIFCEYSKGTGAWSDAFTENNPTLDNPHYSYSDIEISVRGTSIDGVLIRVRAQEKFI